MKKTSQSKARKSYRPRNVEPVVLRLPDTDISNDEHPLANLHPEQRIHARQTVIASILARLAESHADDRIEIGTMKPALKTVMESGGSNED